MSCKNCVFHQIFGLNIPCQACVSADNLELDLNTIWLVLYLACAISGMC